MGKLQMNKLREIIRERAREVQIRTESELAYRTGFSGSYVSAALAGRKRIRGELAHSMADVLGYRAEAILTAHALQRAGMEEYVSREFLERGYGPGIFDRQRDETFPRYVRRVREMRGLLQKEVAKKIGVSKGHLSSIEHGRFLPSLKVIGKLAKVYGIDPSNLYPDMEE